jgi:PhoPQ-activated pathogenicity-related protein
MKKRVISRLITTLAARSKAPKRRRSHRGAGSIFTPLAALLWLWSTGAFAGSTLRDYVNAPDPAYGYRRVTTVARPGCTIHVLNMVSQHWRVHAEVNRVLWRHWMAVIVPDGVHADTAMLIVEGGSNTRFQPSLDNPVVAAAEHVATTTKTTVAILGQVPNQPLYFADAPEGLVEDEIVAYTWAKAMDTGDYTWPAYVPMVKSVVRAMDAVQAFMSETVAHPVRRFVLVGFSKRGAATWLASAVDPRVTAFASGVFDVLDIVAQLEHQFSAYGRYVREMHAYVERGVVRRLRSPEGQELLRVVDPFFYLDSVQQPKFLINATGDPFFLPDAALQYVDRLRGETLLRYVPNADHSLRNRENSVMDLVDGLISWYGSLLADAPRPHITWSVADGRLDVRSTPSPLSMRLWQANNPKARDFRKKTIGESWKSVPLDVNERGDASAALRLAQKGWSAYFVELHYPGVGGLPQVYSTPVFVQPNTLPHPLSDPVKQPRDVAYWKDQIARALANDFSAEIGATQMADYLPLPLFDTHVRDLAAAGRIMDSGDDPADQAQRQCLATRLNIKRRQLGWYSRLRIDETAGRYLWQYYRDAHEAYLHGDPARARGICAAINAGAAPTDRSRSLRNPCQPGSARDDAEQPASHR